MFKLNLPDEMIECSCVVPRTQHDRGISSLQLQKRRRICHRVSLQQEVGPHEFKVFCGP